MNDLKEKNGQKDNKIVRNIKLWALFKFLVGLMFAGLITYKLIISDVVFDFSKFDFNALLSLLLALFAISLSVAFYFKATDTSNLFYDNTYKFTKEISEILGRIEAGFGERLRHLDEGYSGLVNKFDNGSSEKSIQETKEEIEKEKLKLKQDVQERNNILNSLIEKAQLEQHEKEEIRKQLKSKELEISKQNREINFLRNRLESENENEDANLDNYPSSVINLFVNYIRQTKDPEAFLKYPISIISRKFTLNVNDINMAEKHNLMKMRLIYEDGSFSIQGVKLLRQLARKLV